MAQQLEYIGEPNTGCWLWTGRIDRLGYGRISGRLAHRVMFEKFKSVIPNGIGVLHHCDVRCCVNPDHLYLGTQKDNMADAVRRGRRSHLKGEKASRLVTTMEMAQQIKNTGGKYRDIARLFEISFGVVQQIKAGEHWTSRLSVLDS